HNPYNHQAQLLRRGMTLDPSPLAETPLCMVVVRVQESLPLPVSPAFSMSLYKAPTFRTTSQRRQS
ncbi:hypothetical protein STEG23_026947, partial [Scotinomys teguina]